jgi:hypothetical protein
VRPQQRQQDGLSPDFVQPQQRQQQNEHLHENENESNEVGCSGIP